MIRYFIFLTLFVAYSFGCEGNCFACHPSLEKGIEKDSRHVVILECIECHKDLDVASMSESDSCAGDCFVCHSPKKLANSDIVAHQKIENCRECHMEKYENTKDYSNPFLEYQNSSVSEGFLFNKIK